LEGFFPLKYAIFSVGKCLNYSILTRNRPVLAVKLSFKRNWKDFFPLKYAILSFGKCLNYYISGFQRGDIFLNCNKTELKKSS